MDNLDNERFDTEPHIREIKLPREEEVVNNLQRFTTMMMDPRTAKIVGPGLKKIQEDQARVFWLKGLGRAGSPLAMRPPKKVKPKERATRDRYGNTVKVGTRLKGGGHPRMPGAVVLEIYDQGKYTSISLREYSGIRVDVLTSVFRQSRWFVRKPRTPSRGRGNQHTPDNYPWTRRKRPKRVRL